MNTKSEQTPAKQTAPRPTGQQRTYVYSQEAIAVLEGAKESGCKLNEFVSEAIIEYGKQNLDSTEGIPLKQQIENLERVVACIGIKQIQSLVRINKIQPSKLKEMIESIKDCPTSPHGIDLSEKCKQFSRDLDAFTNKNELPLWWILFYAVQKKIKIEE